jgi:hypothetical protein
MIEQLQLFFKDPAKVARLMIICFFATVILSGIFLFTLKNDLVYQGGMIDSGRATIVFVKLFVVIGLAFAFCFAAIRYLQISTKETIVYLDKKIGTATDQQDAESDTAEDTLNASSLLQAIGKLKTNDEKFQEGLNHLCRRLNAGQGALYLVHNHGDKKTTDLKSGFAIVLAEGEKNPSFEWGEGLIGQVAASGKSTYLDELPEGYAARIESGLGSALPKFLFVLPIKKENEVKGVIEVALFTALPEQERKKAEEAVTILAEI